MTKSPNSLYVKCISQRLGVEEGAVSEWAATHRIREKISSGRPVSRIEAFLLDNAYPLCSKVNEGIAHLAEREHKTRETIVEELVANQGAYGANVFQHFSRTSYRR